MLDYNCWFLSDGKNSRKCITSDSSKNAAKEFVKRNWCNRKNAKMENPWNNIYAVSVEDIAGILCTWSVTIDPSFRCQPFVKIRSKKIR